MLRKLLRPFAQMLSNYCWLGRTELVVNNKKHPSAVDRYILVGAVQDLSIQVRSGGGYEIIRDGLTVLMLTDAEFSRARDRTVNNPEDIPPQLNAFIGD